MKRVTVLAVITLFVLGCSSAFGQGFELGFLSSDMSTLYCNFEVVSEYGALASGVDVLEGCGAPDGVMIGLQATFPPSKLPLAGKYYVLADSVIDADCICFSGDQAITVTGTTAYNIHAPHFGWELLFNTYDGFYAYLNNWGYLTNDLPLAKTEKTAQKAPPTISLGTLSKDHNVMQ